MSLQTIVITVDVPADEDTAVETAAAGAVTSLQDAGVTVTAATFGGSSLLPSPTEILRAKIDALASLTSGSGRPTAADLQAAVAAVDAAAAVVEAATPPAPAAPAAPAGQTAVALPDDTGAAPAAVAVPTDTPAAG